MRPDVFDEIQLLAGVRRQPEDLNPFSETLDRLLQPLRGVRRTVVQNENDPPARTPRPLREKIQETNRLFGDGVLPQPIRELEWTVRIAKGSADPNAVVLAGRFDPQRLSSTSIRVGGDRQEIEAHSVPVPQLEIRSGS